MYIPSSLDQGFPSLSAFTRQLTNSPKKKKGKKNSILNTDVGILIVTLKNL